MTIKVEILVELVVELRLQKSGFWLNYDNSSHDCDPQRQDHVYRP
jgi:hypothetical protein